MGKYAVDKKTEVTALIQDLKKKISRHKISNKKGHFIITKFQEDITMCIYIYA